MHHFTWGHHLCYDVLRKSELYCTVTLYCLFLCSQSHNSLFLQRNFVINLSHHNKSTSTFILPLTTNTRNSWKVQIKRRNKYKIGTNTSIVYQTKVWYKNKIGTYTRKVQTQGRCEHNEGSNTSMYTYMDWYKHNGDTHSKMLQTPGWYKHQDGTNTRMVQTPGWYNIHDGTNTSMIQTQRMYKHLVQTIVHTTFL